MDILQSILFGLIQGLGEFLPISSTAHLVLVPWFFGWSDPGLAFDVALHLGTLIAVLAYFWKDWLEIFKSSSSAVFHTKYKIPAYRTGGQNTKYKGDLLWLLVIASIPGALFGLLFEKKAETVFRSPLLIACALSMAGVVLFLVDRYAMHKKNIDKMSFKDALLIGCSQALAIIPGVSRSGATMTAGLALGFSREGAARFSFLLSTPIIFGAAALKIPHLVREGVDPGMLIAIACAALSGYLAIKYMLKLITKIGYAPFFYYRLALAAAVVIFFFVQ